MARASEWLYLVTLSVAVILLVTGAASPFWMTHDSGSFGIWQICSASGVCVTNEVSSSEEIWIGMQILVGLSMAMAAFAFAFLLVAFCCFERRRRMRRMMETGAKSLAVAAGGFGVVASAITIWLLVVLTSAGFVVGWAFILYVVGCWWLLIQGAVGLCIRDGRSYSDPYSNYEMDGGYSPRRRWPRMRRQRRRYDAPDDPYYTRASSWIFDDDSFNRELGQRRRRRLPRNVDSYEHQYRPSTYDQRGYDDYGYDPYRRYPTYDVQRYDPYSYHHDDVDPYQGDGGYWPFTGRSNAYNNQSFGGLFPYY